MFNLYETPSIWWYIWNYSWLVISLGLMYTFTWYLIFVLVLTVVSVGLGIKLHGYSVYLRLLRKSVHALYGI